MTTFALIGAAQPARAGNNFPGGGRGGSRCALLSVPPAQADHQSGSPWNGHTVTLITSLETGELTSSNQYQAWYQLPSLAANIVFEFALLRATKKQREGFTDKSRIERPKLTMYDHHGNPVVKNGVAAARTTRGKNLHFFFIPDTAGTYYLQVSSVVDDGGAYRLSYKRINRASKGDDITGDDCEHHVPSRPDDCAVMLTAPSVQSKFDTHTDWSDTYDTYLPGGGRYRVCVTVDFVQRSQLTVDYVQLITPTGRLFGMAYFWGVAEGETVCTPWFTVGRTDHYKFHLTAANYQGNDPFVAEIDYAVSIETG